MNWLLSEGKLDVDELTVKRLSEIENDLRKATCLKLSASESLEDSKKQKKCLKKLLAWEKQKLKLQDEIIAEKEKTKALYYALTQITQDEKEIEEKRGQEQKAKEQALALVEEEQRSKEAAEAHNNGGNKVTCPCRRALVQKRIRIFGATS